MTDLVVTSKRGRFLVLGRVEACFGHFHRRKFDHHKTLKHFWPLKRFIFAATRQNFGVIFCQNIRHPISVLFIFYRLVNFRTRDPISCQFLTPVSYDLCNDHSRPLRRLHTKLNSARGPHCVKLPSDPHLAVGALVLTRRALLVHQPSSEAIEGKERNK